MIDNDMPCLRDLSIDSCPLLASLPSFQYLTSLQCLDINRCPLLQSLPEGGLPSSLKTLIILESDILKDRCKVGEGADWKKIRWIPTILIENMVIPAQRPDNQVLDVGLFTKLFLFLFHIYCQQEGIIRSAYQYIACLSHVVSTGIKQTACRAGLTKFSSIVCSCTSVHAVMPHSEFEASLK